MGGSVNAKPIGSTARSRSGYSKRQSSSLVSVIRGIMLALAASALPFLIIYSLPSLQCFFLEVIPSFWRCSCDLFTPRNLFLLLNLIILSIFAMAHLHSSQAAAASNSSLRPPVARNHPAQLKTSYDAVSRSVSEEIKLDDHKFEDLQLANEVESTNQQINDLVHMDQPTNHSDDDRDSPAISTGLTVVKEVIRETHLQQEVDYGQHCADHHPIEQRKADPERKKTEKAKIRQEGIIHCADEASDEKLGAQAESKKAEKATQGNNKFGNNIDFLLSDEGSIFTRVQSRPLPSARFTHKKATKLSGLDRPLSPLKMSRPILKRGDTLEATWKAICESKRHSSPLQFRHHSKHTRKVDNSEEIIQGIVMHSLHNHELAKATPSKRGESSMPQEELNAKVESFISRFNEKIRIQREKSLLDYMEMVGRGAS